MPKREWKIGDKYFRLTLEKVIPKPEGADSKYNTKGLFKRFLFYIFR